MRNIILNLALFACLACNRTNSYDIHGNLPGAPEGSTVKLLNIEAYPTVVIDSAIVTNQQFRLKGNTPLDAPHYCRLLFDLTPDETDMRKKTLKAHSFFVDNSSMTFHCIADSLPGYYYEPVSKAHNVTLSGGKTQDLYNRYLQSVRPLTKRKEQLRNQYLATYHLPALRGTFNTVQGIELARQMETVKQQLNQQTLDFIHRNSNSPVALLLATNYLRSNRSGITSAEINTLLQGFDLQLTTHPLHQDLQTTAQRMSAIAQGVKYHDIPLTDLQGNIVQLSAHIKPGMYNMLEFWASWCGPCRGEIPHLRYLYNSGGKEHLHMVSISIDECNTDWKKAVSEEHMEWTQLCDPNGCKGPVANVYKLTGVPYCLILDPDGRIVAGGLRGAELDLVLIDLLGDKITP